MSALTTLFSSLANKIRSKTGGSDTYTPTEMVDAIDDVFDAGVESATTPITPSNSTPVSMLSGSGYKPTANGYAISSYDSVTPSSTPESVASGDIVKIGGSGVIVDAVPTPTSITPSNSSPASMTSGNIYQPTANGVAVASVRNIDTDSDLGYVIEVDEPTIVKSNIGKLSAFLFDKTHAVHASMLPMQLTYHEAYFIYGRVYAVASLPTDITPSNSSPVALTANTPVNPTASGYAIESYQSKTPSSSGVSFNSGIVKMSSSGYAYSERPCGRVLFGATFTASRTTSWTPYEFASESYDPSGTSSAVALDNHFCHIDANGDLVVDRAISTAYLAGGAMRGVTSSGTAVYCGIAIYKNGSLVHSVYGNSTTTSPTFRRIQTSFAVGDVIQIRTKCSTTTQGYAKAYLNMTYEGT